MSVILLRPLWLLALLAVLAAAIWVRRRRMAGDWAQVVDGDLLPALRKLGLLVDGRRNRAAMLPFLAAGIMAVAMAGPAVLRPGAVAWRALDPLILVLDLSPSVVADDRVLGQLQSGAAMVLADAQGRPVGMMVYAGDAYLASAPTTDPETISGLLAVLGQDTMPVVGSRPDIALSMARDLFGGKDGPGIGGADLVVISDGGGMGARATEEAARLAHDGARVWALILPGVAEGAPAANPQGMDDMARAAGGAAVPVAEVADLTRRIAAARTARLAQDPQAGLSFRDLGPWLLPLAMLALLPMFRRRR